METHLEHPYWDLYSRLRLLEDEHRNSSGKVKVVELAEEAGFNLLQTVQLRLLLSMPFSSFAMIQRHFFCVMRERFAYSVLSPVVIELLAQLSPIVEIGAGNGYIAWLLRQKGADVIALDRFPIEEGRNWFFNTRYGFPSRGGRSWSDVRKGDACDLENLQGRALLMCWPPRNSMALDTLRLYSGRHLAIITDRTCCASREFYIELQRDWNLEYGIETGSWSSCHVETLEIYVRKTSAPDEVIGTMGGEQKVLGSRSYV